MDLVAVRLVQHLVARARVVVSSDFEACVSQAPLELTNLRPVRAGVATPHTVLTTSAELCHFYVRHVDRRSALAWSKGWLFSERGGNGCE